MQLADRFRTIHDRVDRVDFDSTEVPSDVASEIFFASHISAIIIKPEFDLLTKK